MKFKTRGIKIDAMRWDNTHRHDDSNWTDFLIEAHDKELFLYNDSDYEWYLGDIKVKNNDWIFIDNHKFIHVMSNDMFNLLFIYDKEQVEYDNLMKFRKTCTHEYIEYDNTYEMRSREMHCKICGKDGSREELLNERELRLNIK